VTPEDFADAFMAQWRVSMPRDEFLDAFKHWVVGVIGEAQQLIADLAGDYRLACLSNLNPLHWERCVELGVDQLFADRFLSFELGLRKPQPESYAAVIDRLGVAPGEVMFFDDVAANVDAARAAGMGATLVDDGLAGALGKSNL
jgi:putative hydrolase of the HAD superfamily